MGGDYCEEPPEGSGHEGRRPGAQRTTGQAPTRICAGRRPLRVFQGGGDISPSLLATDGCTLEFTDDGIHRMAEIAYAVNEKTENIGARRLYTVLEKLVEDVAFSAGSGTPGTERVRIDAQYVDDRLGDLARNEDLARYVL